MKVKMWHDENGSPFFSAGEEGARYSFDPEDDDTVAVAFTKAVNDIIEGDEEVEGHAALAVAQVLKDAGALAWPAGYGYNELREEIQEALPQTPNGSNASLEGGSSYYVQDIALDAAHALVCGWINGADEHYVVPFTLHEDGSVVVGDKSQWVEVEQEFVAKAGRMFSARNLTAMQEARDALDALIQAGHNPAAHEADAEEAGEEVTFKGVEMSYTVEKSDADMRYTLGPLYAPMREDAHGEWIEDEALHKSLHEYVRDSSDSGRRINLQHGEKGDIQVGEWVECVRWPYEHTIKMTNSKNEEYEVEMPVGTVYLGVVWDEEYWDVEKSRPKGIDGYSLGGRAVKIRGTDEALKTMSGKVKKAAPVSEPEPTPVVEPVEKEIDIDAIRAAAVADEQRHTAELERANVVAEESRSTVVQLIDTLKAAFNGPKANVHVHVPDTVVNLGDDGESSSEA